MGKQTGSRRSSAGVNKMKELPQRCDSMKTWCQLIAITGSSPSTNGYNNKVVSAPKCVVIVGLLVCLPCFSMSFENKWPSLIPISSTGQDL